MVWLLLVSVLWAFSFGLAKQLAGLDSAAVATVRLGLSLLVFLPWLRLRGVSRREALTLAAIGAVQFGLMYVAYLASFRLLPAYAVALFTIFTPLYVVLFDAALERRWHGRFFGAALLAIVGTGIVMWKQAPDAATWQGFALVQLSNVCFAAGQLAWRRTRGRMIAAESAGNPAAHPASTISARPGSVAAPTPGPTPADPGEKAPAPVPGRRDAQLFALAYAGALAATSAWSAAFTDWSAFAPTAQQWVVLGYLGVVASGAGFFLWNLGARQVNAGTLAALNNAKVPLGVACSLLFFGEQAALLPLLVGGALVAAGVAWADARPAARQSARA